MEIGLKVLSKRMLQVELFADDSVLSYVTEWSVEKAVRKLVGEFGGRLRNCADCASCVLTSVILGSAISMRISFNPSAWGHLNPSSYCDVGRLFYGVFKLWSKLQRKK